MATVIKLTGAAAADAQTLVTELLAEQTPVTAIDNGDADRNLAQVAVDLGVSLVAAGAYDAVARLVKRWKAKRGHNDSDVVVEPQEETNNDTNDTNEE